MRVKKFIEDVINTLASVCNAIGAASLYERLTRAIRKCPINPSPENNCNEALTIEMSSMSLGLAWLNYAIQWIPLLTEEDKWPKLNAIYSRSNLVINIISMWNFYAYLCFAAYAEVNGKDKEISWGEFATLIIGCLIWSLASDFGLRENLRTRRYGNVERGYVARGCDGTFEFCKGAANGRNFTASVENSMSSTIALSTTGTVFRYLAAAINGGFSAYVGARYSPNLKTEDLFSKPTQATVGKAMFIINGLLPPLLLSINYLKSVYSINSTALQSLFGIGFYFLLPAAFIKSLYVPQPNQPSVLIEEINNDAEAELESSGSRSPTFSQADRLSTPSSPVLWNKEQNNASKKDQAEQKKNIATHPTNYLSMGD